MTFSFHKFPLISNPLTNQFCGSITLQPILESPQVLYTIYRVYIKEQIFCSDPGPIPNRKCQNWASKVVLPSPASRLSCAELCSMPPMSTNDCSERLFKWQPTCPAPFLPTPSSLSLTAAASPCPLPPRLLLGATASHGALLHVVEDKQPHCQSAQPPSSSSRTQDLTSTLLATALINLAPGIASQFQPSTKKSRRPNSPR